jgi:hypothetical protein
VPALPFAFGKPIETACGPITFTLGPDGGLVMESGPDGPSSVLLLDELGRPVGAGSREGESERGTIELGRSVRLRDAAAVVLNDDAVTEDMWGLYGVGLYALEPGGSVAVSGRDAGSELTKAKVVRFAREADGGLSATVELVSTDHWKEFQAGVCLALVSPSRELIAARQASTEFRVEADMGLAEVTLEFQPMLGLEEASHFIVGVARGRDRGQYHGHGMWLRFLNTDEPLFPPERILEAQDPAAWGAGFRALDRELRDDVLRKEMFDELRDHERAVERGRTREALIEPHADRLVAILDEVEDPDAIALLCRLIGHAGREGDALALRPMLDHPDETVRDGAAVGLGMLGREDGLDRLDPILARPRPEGREAWLRQSAWEDDAALALLGIGGDVGTRSLGEALVRAVEGITITPSERGGYGVGGTYRQAEHLIRVLGHTGAPLAIEYLREAAGGDEEKVDQVRREIMDTLSWFGKDARPALLEAVLGGDGAALRQIKDTGDAYYVPFVRDLILGGGADGWIFFRAVDYLWNVPRDDGLPVLREFYDLGLHGDFTYGRMRLCRALAYHGDYRGLPEAFAALVRLQRPAEPPEEEAERKQWERERERELEEALEVFGRRLPQEQMLGVVRPALQAPDPPTVLGALRVLAERRGLPEAIRPQLEMLATDPARSRVAEEAEKLLRRGR